MIVSLRVVTLLLMLRLFVLDIDTARSWWDWVTVIFDVLLAATIFYDRAPEQSTEEEDIR